MNDIFDAALARRDNTRKNAIAAIKSTRRRLKPANLKQEAKDNLAHKARSAADSVKQKAGQHRFKLMAATGITLGAALALTLYTPVRKRLSGDRKV